MRRVILVGVLLLVAVVVIFILRNMPSRTQLPIKTLDPWILQSNNPDDPYGTYVGNGCIATRVGAEGTGSRNGQPLPCLMNGFYEGEALKALPNWSYFPLYDGEGRRFELDKKAPYRQTLNMRDGYVETELILKAGSMRLKGKITLFVLRSEAAKVLSLPQNVGIIRCEFTPRGSGIVTFKDKEGRWSEPPNGWSSASANGEKDTLNLQAVDSNGNKVRVAASVVDETWQKSNSNERRTRKEPFVITKYVEMLPEQDHPCDKSMDKPKKDVRTVGFDNIFSAHKKAWRDTWKSDIVIEGDPAAQQAVHAMMFYLLCSANPNYSIPPTGLSSGAWQGHIFWDADIWMFPALLLQHPELARGMTKYRLDKLPGYLENAKERGLKGAEVAWESARTGRETIGPPHSEERHVTADAAIAVHMMALSDALAGRVENDSKDSSLVFLTSTADYWTSRVNYNKEKDRYEILKVVSPDEDAQIVDNSVYTNIAAKLNLEIAASAAKKAGKSYPAAWEEIAKKMYVPFDEKNHRFLEYDGYDGHVTKQADVELLIYPLMHPMTTEVKRSTFDFYKSKTNPKGPAMTSSIHAIIAAELGRPEEAYQDFTASYQDFLRGPFLMFNEKRSVTYDNMCFLTGCAGSIQSVIYGFGGIRIDWRPDNKDKPGEISFNPVLPPNWKSLKITNIQWGKKTFDLIVEQGKTYKIVDKQVAAK